MNRVAGLDRYRGCLLGLAAGDALGTTLEFRRPGSFKPITDMVGGGPFRLGPGMWTDDTSMALCLAESLIERKEFDPEDQMRRYVRWYQEGHLSSNGYCFDIGNTTRESLQRFIETGQAYAGATHAFAAGNGSLMRLAPVPMYFAQNAEDAIALSGNSSRTTHCAPEAIDACRYFGGMLVGALNGEDKDTLLGNHYCPTPGYWARQPLADKIAEIAGGSFKRKSPPEIRGTGYVVESLEAALWAFYNSQSFGEGALMAANLGDAADTTAAIYGQIAGACYGAEVIPSGWRSKLAHRELITEMADSIHGQR